MLNLKRMRNGFKEVKSWQGLVEQSNSQENLNIKRL